MHTETEIMHGPAMPCATCWTQGARSRRETPQASCDCGAFWSRVEQRTREGKDATVRGGGAYTVKLPDAKPLAIVGRMSAVRALSPAARTHWRAVYARLDATSEVRVPSIAELRAARWAAEGKDARGNAPAAPAAVAVPAAVAAAAAPVKRARKGRAVVVPAAVAVPTLALVPPALALVPVEALLVDAVPLCRSCDAPVSGTPAHWLCLACESVASHEPIPLTRVIRRDPWADWRDGIAAAAALVAGVLAGN